MARKNDNLPLASLTAKATSAIATSGLLVKFDTDEDYCVISGVGAEPLGVLSTTADANEEVSITTAGVVPVRLGGTVADQTYFETDSAGRAVTATGLRPVGGKVITGGAVNELRSAILGAKPNGVIYGAAVASAAAIVPTGNVFHVTGTTNITSITSTGILAGARITIIFDGILTFTDGSNLVLAGNLVTTADDTISLVYDGTNWYETARSVN